MADLVQSVGVVAPRKWVDLGDGTYAPVVVLVDRDIEIGAVEIKDGGTDRRAVVDANGALATAVAQLPASPGQKTAAGSLSVVLASDGPGATAFGSPADAAVTNPSASASIIAALKGLLSLEVDLAIGDYKTVAASQTALVLGTTGAVGDVLQRLVIVPASVNAGAVSITDGGGSAITVFAGGTASISSLAPISVSLGLRSASGAWKVTTGASVSAIAIGNFT